MSCSSSLRAVLISSLSITGGWEVSSVIAQAKGGMISTQPVIEPESTRYRNMNS